MTELIASRIGNILGLQMMKVEMVTRKGRRGCLLKNFVKENRADMNSEGGALLANLVEYEELQESSLINNDLIDAGFRMIQHFKYWELIKSDFINMQIFDILIGNQDRHPYNWMLLFFNDGDVKFSPIYDNGASLGWRFTDEKLMTMVTDPAMNKYTKNTKLKAGLFERKSVKGKDLLVYINKHFPEECERSIQNLITFDMEEYSQFINSLNILSQAQMKWLLHIIPFRKRKILEWLGREEEQ
ncbi:HipA domain-containing protein [Virgibacillus natechei]|uniref:HipA domain-containing protein n=1 Tax=Virgibacillus natechei TaxID=1216297 RepID=UPI00222F3B90|nr:HipA domain-containing protein [Virgibacillus natechei]